MMKQIYKNLLQMKLKIFNIYKINENYILLDM